MRDINKIGDYCGYTHFIPYAGNKNLEDKYYARMAMYSEYNEERDSTPVRNYRLYKSNKGWYIVYKGIRYYTNRFNGGN